MHESAHSLGILSIQRIVCSCFAVPLIVCEVMLLLRSAFAEVLSEWQMSHSTYHVCVRIENEPFAQAIIQIPIDHAASHPCYQPVSRINVVVDHRARRSIMLGKNLAGFPDIMRYGRAHNLLDPSIV